MSHPARCASFPALSRSAKGVIVGRAVALTPPWWRGPRGQAHEVRKVPVKEAGGPACRLSHDERLAHILTALRAAVTVVFVLVASPSEAGGGVEVDARGLPQPLHSALRAAGEQLARHSAGCWAEGAFRFSLSGLRGSPMSFWATTPPASASTGSSVGRRSTCKGLRDMPRPPVQPLIASGFISSRYPLAIASSTSGLRGTQPFALSYDAKRRRKCAFIR